MDAPRSPAACDHLHDATTRYDHHAKRLDFFLVCPVCRTATPVHSLAYEPRFEPLRAAAPAANRRISRRRRSRRQGRR